MVNLTVHKDIAHKTITTECTFNAPKAKLWKAYTNQEWFEKWWGPEGWVTTTKEFDFRPGGRIHYGMKCVDESQGEWFGQESWGLTLIEVVDELTSYRARDHFSDAQGTINPDLPTMVMENHFTEVDGKTTVSSKVITESTEQLEQLIKMGMIEGFASQLNKLEALLDS